MPNGMGKTTTMRLIRASLTEAKLEPDEVRELRPADDTETGSFELRVKFADQLYRIILNLDYENGSYSYFTTRASRQGGGLEPGLLLPIELKALLTPEFTRLFVFDGELAKQIRDLGKQHARDAIKALYNLDRIDALQKDLDRLLKLEQDRAIGSKAMEEKGLNRLRNSLNEAEVVFTDLKLQSAVIASELNNAEAELASLNDKKKNHIESDDLLNERQKSLGKQLSECDRTITAFTKDILNSIRNPASLGTRNLERFEALASKLQRLKLPDTTASEFFKELAEEELCVCGRVITESERSAILSRAETYLAGGQTEIINQVKGAIRVREADEDVEELSLSVGRLKELLRTRNRLNVDLQRLDEQLVANGNEELQLLFQGITRLHANCEALRDKQNRLTVSDKSEQAAFASSWKTNLPLCEAVVLERNEKLKTATETRRFSLQIDVVKTSIKAISENIFEKLSDRIKSATNEKLATFLTERIKVSSISGGLALESERLGKKAGVSEGQSLAVAYAFLTSLFADAPYKLPFIVDSPAVSLDVNVRREVSELVPGLFDQMIMFVISSEREGFAETFYRRENTRLLTVVKNNNSRAEVFEGVDTFKAFHGDEDEKLVGSVRNSE
jgi:hypothetical protein